MRSVLRGAGTVGARSVCIAIRLYEALKIMKKLLLIGVLVVGSLGAVGSQNADAAKVSPVIAVQSDVVSVQYRRRRTNVRIYRSRDVYRPRARYYGPGSGTGYGRGYVGPGSGSGVGRYYDDGPGSGSGRGRW